MKSPKILNKKSQRKLPKKISNKNYKINQKEKLLI